MDCIKRHILLRKANLLKGVYVNNYLNRKLGRVGQVYGKQSEELRHIRHNMVTDEQASRIPSTEDRYFRDGEWSPERRELHKSIVEKYVSSKPSQEKPKVILLAGGGGSGKSFIYESKVKDNIDSDSFVYLNSDDVKEELPEYNILLERATNVAASKVHEESSHVTKRVLQSSVERKQNLVYDAVLGNPYKAQELISSFKNRGYDIELHFIDTELNVATKSATLRAERSGRFVPKDVLTAANVSARETFNTFKNSPLISKVVKYDNSGQLERKEPRVEIVK